MGGVGGIETSEKGFLLLRRTSGKIQTLSLDIVASEGDTRNSGDHPLMLTATGLRGILAN